MENQYKSLLLIEDLGMMYPTNTSIHKRRYSLYKCYCGNEFKAATQDVRRKDTTNCGCRKKKGTNTTHNLSKSRIYSIWCNMKSRVLNKNNQRFLDYGDRGIIICSDWINDFMSFYNWSINNGYKEGLTIDRENNDGNYEPSNCRWVTDYIQNRNKRKRM